MTDFLQNTDPHKHRCPACERIYACRVPECADIGWRLDALCSDPRRTRSSDAEYPQFVKR